MNPGPVEEAGKATGLFMEIMRGQPISLALVITNILLLALFFYTIKMVSENRQKEMDRMFEAQAETNKLLYQCVPGPRTEMIPLPRPKPAEMCESHECP